MRGSQNFIKLLSKECHSRVVYPFSCPPKPLYQYSGHCHLMHLFGLERYQVKNFTKEIRRSVSKTSIQRTITHLIVCCFLSGVLSHLGDHKDKSILILSTLRKFAKSEFVRNRKTKCLKLSCTLVMSYI